MNSDLESSKPTKANPWGQTQQQNLAPYIWGPIAWFFIVFCSYSVKNIESLCDFVLQIKYILPCSQCRDNYTIKLEKYHIGHQIRDPRQFQQFVLSANNELRQMSKKDPIDEQTLINMVFGTLAFLKKMKAFNPDLFCLEMFVFYISCILFTFRGEEYVEQYYNHLQTIITSLSHISTQTVARELALKMAEKKNEFLQLHNVEDIAAFMQKLIDEQKARLQQWHRLDSEQNESYMLEIHPKVIKRVKDYLDQQPLVSELTTKQIEKLNITEYEMKNWYKYIELPKLDINSPKMPMYVLIVEKQTKNYRELYTPNEDALQSDMNTFTLFALITFMFILFVIVILVVSLVQKMRKRKCGDAEKQLETGLEQISIKEGFV